jgi:hypothetical protein
MANMSYCRFENTFKDLQDCYMNMDYVESNSESNYRLKLVELCKDIVSEYGDEVFDDDYEEVDDNWDPDTAYENDRDLQLEFPTE